MRRLLIFSHYGNAQEVEEILNQNDPFLINYSDQLGQTSLHFASSAGRVDVAKVLLQRGANVNAKDIDGGTPLSLACAKGNLISELTFRAETIVGHAAIVDLLLKFGADLETRNRTRQTPLFCAAMAGASEVFKLLVEFGANYNAKNGQNRTPLDCPHLQCPTSVFISVIERHMTKMASARLPYTKLAFYRPGAMDLDEKRTYRKKCLAELKRLEEFTFPGSKISLHDFLMLPNSVPSYLRNPDVCKIVTELDLIEDYPIYGRLLEQNLFKGLRRLALVENSLNFFLATQSFSGLPVECVERVCSYLDNGSLSYLGLVWAWSQSKNTRKAPCGTARHLNHCAEPCSITNVTQLKPWSIVGLCLSSYMNPQHPNSIS